MLRVRIELCKHGDERPGAVTEIGRMYIANTGEGDPERGHYVVGVCRRGTVSVPRPVNPSGATPTRHGEVRGYNRKGYNVWRLVARAVLSCFAEERVVARRTQQGDDPAADTGHEPDDDQALELGKEIVNEDICGALIDAHLTVPRHPKWRDAVIAIGREAWRRGARPREF